LFVGHTIRAYKTKILIDQIKPSKLKTNLRALFAGYLFNTLLPFRLGEVIRALILGRSLSISTGFTFSLILLERAVDGLILGSVSLVLFNYSQYIINVDLSQYAIFSYIILLLAIVLFSVINMMRSQNAHFLKVCYLATSFLSDKYKNLTRFKLWSIIYGLQKTIDKKYMFTYSLYSVIMWGFYLSAMYVLASYFFAAKDIFVESVRSVAPYLGTAIPSGPAYIGTYQSIVGPILDSLYSSPVSFTYMIYSWLLIVVPTSLVGVYAVLRTNEDFQKQQKTISKSKMHNKLERVGDISTEMAAFLDAFFSLNSLSHILHKLELNEDMKLIKYFKGGSDASTILVHNNGLYKVRKITPIQHAKKLQNQHDWLREKKSLDSVVNIISSNMTDTYYSIDIEYYPEFIPFFDFIHANPIQPSVKIITEIFEYMFKHIYKPAKESLHSDHAKEYIKNRLVNKVLQASKINPDIQQILDLETLNINGVEYMNILNIIEKISHHPVAMKDISTYRESPIHGDLTVDNILTSTKNHSFKIIDPTDENEISSPVVDFGRQLQSLEFGYEFLCRDERPTKAQGNIISYDNEKSAQYEKLKVQLLKLAKKHLTRSEYKSILFHTGVMYSRMLTHRVHINPNNAVKFYAISVIALNEFYNQYEKSA